MKTCSVCGVPKDESCFGFQSRQCPECKSKKRKEYKLKNKEKLKAERWDYNHSFKGRLVQLIQAAKQRAQLKDVVFRLDKEWIFEQYQKQNGKCLLTDITFTTEPFGDAKCNPYSPSLDRIDPKLGYTKENTRLVCLAINFALNEFGEEVFEQICQAYLACSNTHSNSSG